MNYFKRLSSCKMWASAGANRKCCIMLSAPQNLRQHFPGSAAWLLLQDFVGSRLMHNWPLLPGNGLNVQFECVLFEVIFNPVTNTWWVFKAYLFSIKLVNVCSKSSILLQNSRDAVIALRFGISKYLKWKVKSGLNLLLTEKQFYIVHLWL